MDFVAFTTEFAPTASLGAINEGRLSFRPRTFLHNRGWSRESGASRQQTAQQRVLGTACEYVLWQGCLTKLYRGMTVPPCRRIRFLARLWWFRAGGARP